MKPVDFRGHGLNTVEQAIMDRYDDGLERDEIAAALDIPIGRVIRIVDRYRYSDVDRFAADARRGSAKLLERIRALQARQAVAA